MSQWEQRAASRSVKNFALVENSPACSFPPISIVVIGHCPFLESSDCTVKHRVEQQTPSLSIYWFSPLSADRGLISIYPSSFYGETSFFLERLTRNLFLSLQRRQFRLYCSECSCDWRQYSLTLSFRSISRLRL